MTDPQRRIHREESREENAYVATCTECGLEDSLPVPNGTQLPDIGDVVEQYVCYECGNTTWTVEDHDYLVFQRESRFAEGPDISGSWHRYQELVWRRPHLEAHDDGRVRPECPVRQLGSADAEVECDRLAERVTDADGRGAWGCGWHGVFRVYDYSRDRGETEQTRLLTDGGSAEPGQATLATSARLNAGGSL